MSKLDPTAKIVHLTSVHSPFDVRVFHKECKTLASAGFKVTLIAPHEQDEMVDNVRLCALPKPNGRRGRMTRTVWRIYQAALVEDAHIYHLHDPELLPIGMLLRFQDKRVVYDVHEDLPKQSLTKPWIPSGLRGVVSKSAAALESLAGLVFSGIVAATPTIASRFPVSKTVVVQNFPVVGEAGQDGAFLYTKRPMKVAYVGGITEMRGAREMVQAMAVLPEHLEPRLALAGDFSSRFLEDEIHSLPGWARVEYAGGVERTEMWAMLGKARAGLVLFHPAPNHIEAQPNKLFEYMLAGLPVVASDFPLWRQIVEGVGCGLLVDPLDFRAIAEAIQWLLEHPEEAETMGKRGREAVSTQYNWSFEAEKLLKFYQVLLR